MTKLHKALMVGAAAVLVALPLLLGGSPFILFLVNLAGIYALVAIGLCLLTGFAGQISIGHAAFMAIGAFTSAFLTMRLGLPFWLALPLAGAVAALFGVVLGFPALRLHGNYLAIATLGFGVAVPQVLAKWEAFSGGFQGLKPPAPVLLGLRLRSEFQYYYLVLAVLLLLLAAARNVLRSRPGRALAAMRDSEVAARSLGMNLAHYKLAAFALSAFYAGVAGSLYAHMVRFISPTDFGLELSLAFLAMIVVGGLSSLGGAVAGAAFMTALPHVAGAIGRVLPEALTNVAKTLPQVLTGVILVAAVLLFPGGISGLLQWRSRRT